MFISLDEILNKNQYNQSINQSIVLLLLLLIVTVSLRFLIFKFDGEGVAIAITNSRALDPLMVTQMSYCYRLAPVVVPCPLISSQELLGQSTPSFVYSICRVKRHLIVNFMISHSEGRHVGVKSKSGVFLLKCSFTSLYMHRRIFFGFYRPTKEFLTHIESYHMHCR